MKLHELLNERVFHGSPHNFKTFDISKIGTGEGNQYYGWGLYFTDTKNVAQWYKDALTKQNIDKYDIYVDGKLIKHPSTILKNILHNGYKNNIQQYADMLLKKINTLKQIYNQTSEPLEKMITESELEELEKQHNEVLSYVGKTISILKKGHIYSSELPEHILDTMLDWDKSFNKQSKTVQQILKKYTVKNPNSKINDALQGFEQSSTTGETIYNILVSELDSQKDASLTLNKYGIVGIKYLDKFSRELNSSDTYNYVIFDEKIISIINQNLKKNDQAY